MWARTATTTTEHNLQMRPLEAVPEGSCDPMSEGVGPAQQRFGAEGTGKHLFDVTNSPHVASHQQYQLKYIALRKV